MNKIFLLIIAVILFLPSMAVSQTLQFSQAILLTNSQTVPAGKVWKISNMLPSASLTSGAGGLSSNVSNQTEHKILINGNPIFLGSSHADYSVTTISMSERGGSTAGSGSRPVSAATSSSQTLLNGAIWLPAGTIVAPDAGIFGLSIIEFTVVP